VVTPGVELQKVYDVAIRQSVVKIAEGSAENEGERDPVEPEDGEGRQDTM